MKNIFHIGLFLCLLLNACTPTVPKEEEAPSQPNILFIMTDDHARQAISS